MSKTLRDPQHVMVPATQFETYQTAKQGREIARTLRPLNPGDTFRFPIAVRHVALNQGERTAAEYAMEWATEPTTYPAAVSYVAMCVKIKPVVVSYG